MKPLLKGSVTSDSVEMLTGFDVNIFQIRITFKHEISNWNTNVVFIHQKYFQHEFKGVEFLLTFFVLNRDRVLNTEIIFLGCACDANVQIF